MCEKEVNAVGSSCSVVARSFDQHCDPQNRFKPLVSPWTVTFGITLASPVLHLEWVQTVLGIFSWTGQLQPLVFFCLPAVLCDWGCTSFLSGLSYVPDTLFTVLLHCFQFSPACCKEHCVVTPRLETLPPPPSLKTHFCFFPFLLYFHVLQSSSSVLDLQLDIENYWLQFI